MPMYDVEHFIALSDHQKHQIASAITEIHSEMFTTPRLFVNVNFKDISRQPTYVAGKPRPNNRILANVRTGPGRTQQMFDDTCTQINQAWAKIVGEKGDEELRAIFVYGNIIGGSEAGFPIPAAGQDAEWLKTYMSDFKRLAEEGDEDFASMLEDMRQRKAFKSIIENGSH